MALAQSLLPPLAALMLAPLNPPNDPHNPSIVPQSPGSCPSIQDSTAHAARSSATWLSDYGCAALRRASYIALPCGKLLTSAALLSHRKHDRAAALTTTFDGARIMCRYCFAKASLV